MSAKAKVLEYHCPHCKIKLSNSPKNDHFYMGTHCYGAPVETCKKCQNRYVRSDVTEAAQNLTLSQRVPFWIITPRFAVIFAIIVFPPAFVIGLMSDSTFGFLLIAAIMLLIPYLLLCVLTRSYRQKHKDRVVTASRERMKDVAYFAEYLAHTIGTDGLTPKTITSCYLQAISDMENDQPLDVLHFASTELANHTAAIKQRRNR